MTATIPPFLYEIHKDMPRQGPGNAASTERALRMCGGNQTKTAEMLGLQRSYLNRLMKDLGLRGESEETTGGG